MGLAFIGHWDLVIGHLPSPMAALAAKLCGSKGAYRGPSGNSYVFMFKDIKISKQPGGP
jgi:hypothetical protein